jgi:uroporphyrinogen decarboxylase
MTPRERFHAALDLDRPDRIPTMHIQLGGGYYLQDQTGITIKEAYSDPHKFARLCMASHAFGFDNVMVALGDLLNEAQAFGVHLNFSSDRDYPMGTPIPPESIETLEPVDPLKDKTWSTSLKAAKMVNDEVGGEMAVIGQVSDPFTMAAAVRGFDGLLMDEIMEPDRLHHLLDVITDSLREYGRLLKDHSGVGIVFIEDGSADAEQNTFDFAKTFDIEYCQKLTESFHSFGLKTILSNCAQQAFFDAQFDAVRPTAMHTSFDWSGYKGALSKLRGQACLVAGIVPRFIALSNPDDIRKKVLDVAGSSGDGSGFIITSAGEIPFDAPLDNIRALSGSTSLLKI